MNKIRILNSLMVALLCYGCKTKKTLTFQQQYEEADRLYEKKKFAKAAEIYSDLYPQVPNKIDNIKILKKLADCLYREKKYKKCYNDYKTLYTTVFDGDRLLNGFRMCDCSFNLLEKNNKRDISQAETLLEAIDAVLEENENVDNEQDLKILDDLKKIKDEVLNKIIDKQVSIINTYEKLEMFDATVTCAKNFILKYPDSNFTPEICRTLLKSQYLNAKRFEDIHKKMTEEQRNILFDKWKEIVLIFDNYKDHLQDDGESKNFYEQALKKLNLQK